ncbi:serine hydrolase domain-containing protein [Desulforhopalus singaporensis]|uniref:CubicO group peptidase, beta-lactamase class C family n=1 Tax=Desulforhopalus singaporensis TaxID=91360 RepID=A0A1H0SHN8_9BACT|nr:hypothetical protein [Desulforhopalus singaporensis]SDP41185.1 CubicO group peptidase, beta-lactamase class C family [Desulforhopalus singaporensis]
MRDLVRLLFFTFITSMLVTSAMASDTIPQKVKNTGIMRSKIVATDLLKQNFKPEKPVCNVAFLPAQDSLAAKHSFQGELMFTATEMQTSPDKLKSENIWGLKPKVFPGFKIAMFDLNGALVPVSREIIVPDPDLRGGSFWEIIISPGKVWSEPGDNDWSRASFPFVLMNSIEGESHNGVATFLFNDKEISQVRYQLVQQTSPFYVVDYFTAWGQLSVQYTPQKIANLDQLKKSFEQESVAKLPTAPWRKLEELVGREKLEYYNGAMDPNDLVQNAFIYKGVMYVQASQTAYGDFPYPPRYGVWSMTKSCVPSLTLLRLAQKYGAEVFDLKIKDYVEVTANHDGWENVTFLDAINMATGMANSADSNTDPKGGSTVDYVFGGDYYAWYEARSAAEKTAEVFKVPAYPWGPGKVMRYRDRTMYILGVALNNFLKTKEGPSADTWDMMISEVLRPIGIFHAPLQRTYEKDGQKGTPLSAYGFFPTLDDLAKIGLLIQNKGMHNGQQLLHGPTVETILSQEKRGLPMYDKTTIFGDMYYEKAYWRAPAKGIEGKTVFVPFMRGWGGNLMVIMPNDMIGLRISKGWTNKKASDPSGIIETGNRIEPFVK